MKLSKLKDLVKKLVKRDHKRHKLKHGKIVKVLEKLQLKENQFRKHLRGKLTNKEKKEVTSKLRVVRAQIRKARKLLHKYKS